MSRWWGWAALLAWGCTPVERTCRTWCQGHGFVTGTESGTFPHFWCGGDINPCPAIDPPHHCWCIAEAPSAPPPDPDIGPRCDESWAGAEAGP